MLAPHIGNRGFAPGQLTISWGFVDDGRWDFLPDVVDPKKLLVNPRFDPNLPPYEVTPNVVLLIVVVMLFMILSVVMVMLFLTQLKE